MRYLFTFFLLSFLGLSCTSLEKVEKSKSHFKQLTWKILEEEGKKRKIIVGYYPGGFDPFHKGHEDLIKQTVNKGVDYVVVYPKPDGSAFKPGIKNQKERVALARKALAEYPHILVFDGNLKELKQRFDDLQKEAGINLTMAALTGSDNYRYLSALDSKHPEISFKRSKFIRNSQGQISSDWGPLQVVACEKIFVSIRRKSNDAVLLQLGARPVQFLMSGELGLSSTQIRKQLAKSVFPKRGLSKKLRLPDFDSYRGREELSKEEAKRVKRVLIQELKNNK